MSTPSQQQRFSLLRKWLPFLTKETPQTADYIGHSHHYAQHAFNHNRPIFTRLMAQAMLVDPHVKFGLLLIKGPILSGSRFLVKCEDEELRQFIISQITRFWTMGSAKYALRSLHFGWYGTEIMYRLEGGRLAFDRFRNLRPEDTAPVIQSGSLVGIAVRNNRNTESGEQVDPLYLPCPKAFWTVHAREMNRWWGQSRLYGAHIPWYETNSPGGFRDSRRLYFYKNAFDSGTLRYPDGATTKADGNRLDNRDLAQAFMDSIRNGSGVCLPSTTAANGAGYAWDWERPQSQDLSQSFTEYGLTLRDEVWEALGVPPEIAKAQGTGAYAGRQIPQEAFYSLLQEIVQDLITDFDEQVLANLALIGFGPDHAPYEIECFGLLRSLEEDRGNHHEDGRQPLGVEPGGQQTANPHLSQPPQLQMSSLVLNRHPDTHLPTTIPAAFNFTLTHSK